MDKGIKKEERGGNAGGVAAIIANDELRGNK